MSEAVDEVVHEFIVESYENLDRLDQDLVELEKNPADRERLSSIFRTIHTIKGTCGFLGFSQLEAVTHVGENLLSKLRDGHLKLDATRTSVLLDMVDTVRTILAQIEKSGQEEAADYTRLISRLTALLDTGAATAAPSTSPTVQETSVTHSDEPLASTPPANVEVIEQKSEQPVLPEPPLVTEQADPHQDPHSALHEVSEKKANLTDNSIRVSVDILDNLMNLVGELVLARNQMMQLTGRLKDSSVTETTQRLNLITTELQESVMKTRMQPIGNVWSKFPRVVRDLAVLCGKEVKIEMSGQETELDKTLIEAIKDPLTHIVRNSVDHGIETPDVRIRNNKPSFGTLNLRAFHEGGQVNIEISDDGGGIPPDRIRKKAVEKGLISPDQAARMSDREVISLIFLPGFSTAEKVTNVSGRGVGMDVVKTNIEKIGGQLDIQSREGLGTTIKIKIPLTLAIIPALIVSTGGDRYAIPQLNLLELVRLETDDREHRIEEIHGARVLRLRGKLLPIIDLNGILQLGLSGGASSTCTNIVVLHADGRTFGLVVDAIDDTEEIVVKPLSRYLKGIPAYAGVTIMGDGRVALILDVVSLAQMTGLVSEQHERPHGESRSGSGQGTPGERRMLLIVAAGANRRLAVPLESVSRLEEIPATDVELSGDNEVFQYRGEIMPLIRLATLFGGYGATDTEGKPLHVIVYTDETMGRSIGLVVDSIIDIVEDHVEVKRKVQARGVLASVIVGGKVTELIDIENIIRDNVPTFFECEQPEVVFS